MDILKVVLTFLFAFYLGRHKGFTEGVDSVHFDQATANMKLQHCLRIVRGE
jgi:hypothetical protein